MSEENVQAVRNLIDGWNGGDVDRWLKPTHPDAEWSSAVLRQVEGSAAAVYRGEQELRQFWNEWHELWDLNIEITEIQDLGESVLVLAHMHARGNVSGIDLERPIGYLFEFDRGLIRKARAFLSANEALEAAGLKDPNQVMIVARVYGEGAASGIKLDAWGAVRYTFRDGRIRRVEAALDPDRDRALVALGAQAAGLSE